MPVYFRSEIPERISIIFEAYANFIGRISSIASLTLRLLMSYIYMELLVKPEMLTSYIYIYIYTKLAFLALLGAPYIYTKLVA